MPGLVKHSGTWKEADWFAKVGGSWTQVQTGYVRQSGVWVPFYSAEFVVVAPSDPGSIGIGFLFEQAEPGYFASSKKKRLIVNSSRGPLTMAGTPGGEVTLEIQSNGIVSGIGGIGGTSGVGGQGGHAINISAGSLNVINNGIIRGGGGGGGKGGQGGDGIEMINTREPLTDEYYDASSPPAFQWLRSNVYDAFYTTTIYWNGETVFNSDTSGAYSSTQQTINGITYYRGTLKSSNEFARKHALYRQGDFPTPTVGGAGGNGGRGQGIDGAQASGSSGAAGGTNAGTGGTGGTGGTYGNSGNTGSTGANGNDGNGVAGSPGGASGYAILGYNRVNYSGSGTLIGGTANN